ncbi:unnamed protein product, partial [Allacma fusca]
PGPAGGHHEVFSALFVATSYFCGGNVVNEGGRHSGNEVPENSLLWLEGRNVAPCPVVKEGTCPPESTPPQTFCME